MSWVFERPRLRLRGFGPPRFERRGDRDARISPTAYYTSAVWVAHGLSDPRLATPAGTWLYRALRPMNCAYETAGRGPSLAATLVARHVAIDAVLARAIDSGAVGQVFELAAGMSARALRFTRRYPKLRYVESDLPAIVEMKRELLADRDAGHEIVVTDALADGGPESIAATCARVLTPGVGTAILTEGLLGYVPPSALVPLWRRIAGALGASSPVGLYLSDLAFRTDRGGMRTSPAFVALLRAFSRGAVYLHYTDESVAADALTATGFHDVKVRPPRELADEVPASFRAHALQHHAVRIVSAWS